MVPAEARERIWKIFGTKNTLTVLSQIRYTTLLVNPLTGYYVNICGCIRIPRNYHWKIPSHAPQNLT